MNQTSKTILMVAPYFPPAGGGLERYAFEIARRLQKDYAWRVVVITSGERYGQDETNDSGPTVYRLGYRFKFSNTPFALVGCQIKRILKAENPDIINIHTPVPGIGDVVAMSVGRKPLVVTYHSGSMHKGRLSSDLFIWLYEHGNVAFYSSPRERILSALRILSGFNFASVSYKSTTITPRLI